MRPHPLTATGLALLTFSTVISCWAQPADNTIRQGVHDANQLTKTVKDAGASAIACTPAAQPGNKTDPTLLGAIPACNIGTITPPPGSTCSPRNSGF